MAVTVYVPSILRSCCGGAAEFSLSAASVREAVDQIETDYPQLYQSICDETGALRPHVNLFVNSSLVRGPDWLETQLAAGDAVAIFQAVSGG